MPGCDGIRRARGLLAATSVFVAHGCGPPVWPPSPAGALLPLAGSVTAALITCEKNEGTFGAWGRPFAFHARLLSSLDRSEEARDKARAALDLPLWTLGDDLETVLGLADMDRDALVAKLRTKAAGKLTSEQLKAQNGMEKRSPQQIAKDRASYLLDLVVACPEEYSWQGVRGGLAELYAEADMGSIGAFVDIA